MKINLALLGAMVACGVVGTGCMATADGNGNKTDGNLASNESQLVADNDDVEQQDQDSEAGIEEPLSGSDPSDPGAGGPVDPGTDGGLMEKVRLNPGRWFQPAGCIKTTISGNVATHVFTNCTGPLGLKTFNGTITSTWVRADGSLTVTHKADGFSINGATISGQRVVVYTRAADGTITRHRTGSWSGTTKNGKTFSHDADFTATWNPSTKCVTRDGHAETTVGGREFTRTVTGYKRCGVGSLGCPESGEIVLTRSKGDNQASVTIDFTGGRGYTITGSNGRSFHGLMVCRAS